MCSYTWLLVCSFISVALEHVLSCKL
jgi:hypothetical protein